ncbi:gamma-glutamylcyclotransferase family protein [Spirulina sp. CCNP1310]|nr:gamma-glutamylcyclotransferase family protein [Spirulina sp. CCNP1310]
MRKPNRLRGEGRKIFRPYSFRYNGWVIFLLAPMVDLFVYGTLKPGEMNYAAYCGDRPHTFETAWVWGQLFHLPRQGYPALTPGNEKVQGILFHFDDPQVLAAIDPLETYEEGRSPHLNEYQRQRQPIFDPNGASLGEAWIYVMALDRVMADGGIWLPSGQWSGGGYEG